jgi:hypothetical protein
VPYECRPYCYESTLYYDGEYRDGRCQYKTRNCDALDGDVGGRFCKAGDVYISYKDYYCSYGECKYVESDRKVQDCPGTCYAGECVGGTGFCDCEDVCGEWGEWYQVDEFYKKRTKICDRYSCVDSQCVFNGSYTIVSVEPLPSEPVIIEKNKTFNFTINVSNHFIEKTFLHEDIRVFNGLLFGSGEVKIFLPKSHVWSLNFTVTKTNAYGPLLIYVCDELVYNNVYQPGSYTLDINKEISGCELRIRALSSYWRLWTPNFYDIEDVSVSTTVQKIKSDTVKFELSSYEYSGFTDARIETDTRADIRVNKDWLSRRQIPKEYLQVGTNRLFFMPPTNYDFFGNVSVIIRYNETFWG